MLLFTVMQCSTKFPVHNSNPWQQNHLWKPPVLTQRWSMLGVKHRMWFSAHLKEALRWLLIIEVQSSVQDFSGSTHTRPPGMCLLQSLTRDCCSGNPRPKARGEAAAELSTLQLQTKWVQLHRRQWHCLWQGIITGRFSPLTLNKQVIHDDSSAAQMQLSARAEWCQGDLWKTLPVVAWEQSRGHWGTPMPSKPFWRPSAKRETFP